MGDEPGELKDGIDGVARAARARDAGALVEALGHHLPGVRIAAAEALGEVGGDKARLALLKVARDRHGERPDVRIAAIGALGGVMDGGGYTTFLEGFICSENRAVVAAARGMLESADPPGFPGRLVRAGCLDKAAISVYGTAREESAVPLLKRFLEDACSGGDIAKGAHWGRAYAAVKALGRIGGPGAVELLEHVTAGLSGERAEPRGFLKEERLSKIEAAARESLARAKGA